MRDNIPDKRIVPVLTEVIDDDCLPQHETRGPALEPHPLSNAADELLIDLSDEGLHLPTSAEMPLDSPDLPAPLPGAPVAEEGPAPPVAAVLDDDLLRQLIARAIDRAIPALVEQLLPELRQQLQASPLAQQNQDQSRG